MQYLENLVNVGDYVVFFTDLASKSEFVIVKPQFVLIESVA